MKKLKKIKLNALSEANLGDKEMNSLRGGEFCCGCSCYWEGQYGSSAMDNMGANHESWTESTQGCNQYGWCGEGYEGQFYDFEAHA